MWSVLQPGSFSDSRLTDRKVQGVVVPAGQQLGDVRPAVSQLSVGLTDHDVLVQRPLAFLHCWVQVIVPALTALLPVTTLQVFGDYRPALHAVLLNESEDLSRK